MNCTSDHLLQGPVKTQLLFITALKLGLQGGERQDKDLKKNEKEKGVFI